MTHTDTQQDYLIEAIRQANPHNPDQPNIATITCNTQGPQWAGINVPIKDGHNPRFYPPEGWEIRYIDIDIEKNCLKIELCQTL